MTTMVEFLIPTAVCSYLPHTITNVYLTIILLYAIGHRS